MVIPVVNNLYKNHLSRLARPIIVRVRIQKACWHDDQVDPKGTVDILFQIVGWKADAKLINVRQSHPIYL